MKKFIAIVLAGMMLASMAACTPTDEPKDTTKDTTVDTKADTEDTADTADTDVADTGDESADDTDEPAPVEETSKIAKGTATVDGKLDDAYKASTVYEMPKNKIYDPGNTYNPDAVKANTYFLWDDSYLYAFIDVTDPAVANRGEDYYKNSDNPYENDCTESWFLYNDDMICKIHCSADGNVFFQLGQDAGGMGKKGVAFFDLDNCKKAVAKTATGYAVELALKLDGTQCDDLAAGLTLKYGLQVNDIKANKETPAENGLCCYGVQIPTVKFELAED